MTIEKKYQSKVNALRDMTVEEYEGVIDSLIKELEVVGLFPQYEKVLLEIDDSFDDDFSKKFDDMNNVLDGIKTGRPFK